jgi:hypothetical protein
MARGLRGAGLYTDRPLNLSLVRLLEIIGEAAVDASVPSTVDNVVANLPLSDSVTARLLKCPARASGYEWALLLDV